MANTTKRMLSMSLKKLLSKTTLDSITIQDITDDAEVSRKTFYYHFQDIYDLLDWTLQEDIHRLIVNEIDLDNWEESIEPFTFHCTFSDTSAQPQQAASAPETPTYMLYDGAVTKSIDLSLTDTVIGSNKLWPTDTKTITTDDLSKLTQNEVAAVRNEIYARHGYTFTTDEWKIFFASAQWYHADSAYSNDMLNATEKANVDTILNYEKSAGGQQEKTRPEDMASQAALNYCQTTGWTNSRVNFVESRPAGGYYVNVMKIDDSDNSYEENYVVTVENGKAIVTGTEQFGEFTPID